jgi:hypothetical protein
MLVTFNHVKDMMLARCFVDNENNKVDYPKTSLEKVGRSLSYFNSRATHFLLKNIHNTIMILGLALVAASCVTAAMYPTLTIATLSSVCPWVTNISPWMVKITIYAFVQMNVLGFVLTGLGRLSNQELQAKYSNNEWRPLQMGQAQS